MRSSESLGNWGCALVGSKQRLFLCHTDAFFDLIGRWRYCWSNIRKISGIIAEDLSDSGPRRSFCGPDGAEISLSFKDTLFIIFFERLNDFYWKQTLWSRQAKRRKQLEKQLVVITSKYATRVVVCCENVIRRDSGFSLCCLRKRVAHDAQGFAETGPFDAVLPFIQRPAGRLWDCTMSVFLSLTIHQQHARPLTKPSVHFTCMHETPRNEYKCSAMYGSYLCVIL